MGFEIGISQVAIKREQLAWCEHALIDDDLGREAAGINLLCFGERCIQTQSVGKPLANYIQLSFELFLL